MPLLDRLFPKGMTTALSSRVTTGIKSYSETPGVLWEARAKSSSGVTVDEQEALTLSAVFAACYRLAMLQAQLPIGVYERTPKGREERPQNSVSNLLNVQMSPEMTAFTGRSFMDFWKPLFGAACAEIVWDGAGRAARIYPIGPWRVQVKEDDVTGEVYYLVDGRRRMHPDDMLYVPHITSDGVTGQGFVHFAIESLGAAIAADRAASYFFKNDMKPGGLLRHPNTPNKEARDRFKHEWQAAHGGDKRGAVGVLWGGWEWIKEAGGVDPNKAQLLESRQYGVLEVARWLNVPVHWLGDLTRSTWGNIEHQAIEMLTHVVMPLLVAKEQEYDRKMLTPPRLYCKHNVNALLRGDMKTRGEFYRLMREIGAFNANKVLALEDENGIGPEGDRYFVPVNWQPQDDLMTGAAAAKAMQPEPAPEAPKPDEKNPVEEKPKPKKLAAASVAGVMEHLLAMLLKKECNEANRASKNPKAFMGWMDEFYPAYQEQMAAAVSPVGRWMADILGQPAGNLAAEWAEASRRELLDAMDGPPEGWPARMAELLDRWQSRPAEMSLKWTDSLLQKEMTDA